MSECGADPPSPKLEYVVLLALLKAGRTYEESKKIARSITSRFTSIDALFEWLSKHDDGGAARTVRSRYPPTERDVQAIRRELLDPEGRTIEEQKIMAIVKDFMIRTLEYIRSLDANRLLREEAINPFLVKALGLGTFEEVARYFVYQTVARSIVTSFGTVLEKVGRLLAQGEKKDWWDAVVDLHGRRYYMAIKSGPRTMDADQAREFVRRAKGVVGAEPDAKPVYVGLYGKELWSAAKSVIEKKLGPVDEHVYIGRRFYELVTGDPDYYKRLLELFGEAATKSLTVMTLFGVKEERVMELIESKVTEVAGELEKKYRSVDELVLSLF